MTGSVDFIGANFVLDWLALHGEPVISLDKLTCADNRQNLAGLDGDIRYTFAAGDIGDSQLVAHLLTEHQPWAILNFAAESHADHLIRGPEDFIRTNIVGIFHLPEGVRAHWGVLESEAKVAFRFLHVFIDKVCGSLVSSDPTFTENNRYEPDSPYSASKAASDHLVRIYHHTYGSPVLTTNCSNNYGPYHPPEKLVPLVTHNALAGKPLPIYGDGQQIRNWLYVKDHCNTIRRVLEARQLGETCNVGGWNEKANLGVIETFCAILGQEQSRADGRSYREQITFIEDCLGHDRRYAINTTRLRHKLGWKLAETFETGIRKIVRWYLDNQDWMANVTSGACREWVGKQYT